MRWHGITNHNNEARQDEVYVSHKRSRSDSTKASLQRPNFGSGASHAFTLSGNGAGRPRGTLTLMVDNVC